MNQRKKRNEPTNFKATFDAEGYCGVAGRVGVDSDAQRKADWIGQGAVRFELPVRQVLPGKGDARSQQVSR
jgi:hypothetical protein